MRDIWPLLYWEKNERFVLHTADGEFSARQRQRERFVIGIEEVETAIGPRLLVDRALDSVDLCGAGDAAVGDRGGIRFGLDHAAGQEDNELCRETMPEAVSADRMVFLIWSLSPELETTPSCWQPENEVMPWVPDEMEYSAAVTSERLFWQALGRWWRRHCCLPRRELVSTLSPCPGKSAQTVGPPHD